jgi:serine/threonine-protein kinase
VADRYRIVSLLGRGAMGVVYRAEDLTLSQPVALKFLNPSLAANPVWLARFRAEARLAREVTHPNVCRTFDIGEADGAHFLTMEYVDGENLAMLLARIGRVPVEKAREIGSQICLGLAAAHGAGVLHRDLKPANIMLDGRGQVRITDFGIAGWEGKFADGEIRAGTPAYMAPEQITGRGVTAQSDLYALGCVLYELFAGKPAFRAGTPVEYAELHEKSRPVPLPELVNELDAEVEQAINRCLVKNPRDRPGSALTVASVFLGGDPLAAAVAANQAPTPEMVAAATPRTRFNLPASSLLIATLALLAACLVVRTRWPLPWEKATNKPPAVLADLAKGLAQAAGYETQVGDQAHGFCDVADAASVARGYRSQDRETAALATSRSADLAFWQRYSSDRLAPSEVENVMLGASRVTPDDPPSLAPGMVSLVFDVSGRLVLFAAVPEAAGLADEDASGRVEQDSWSPFLEHASLDPSTLVAVETAAWPLLRADQRWLWRVAHPDDANGTVLVEAYASRGSPVFFAVYQGAPDPGASRLRGDKQARESTVTASLRLLFLLVTIGALPWAWRNSRTGRCDRRGALRLAAFVLVIKLGVWLLRARHVPDADTELMHLSLAALQALGAACLVGLLYTALEPFARRYWPQLLITWARAVTLRLRDPVVGRHVLIGTCFGCFWSLVFAGERVLAGWLGLSAGPPIVDARVTERLLGGRLAVAGCLDAVPYAIFQGLLFILLLAALRAMLRRQVLAAVLAGLLIAPIIVPRGAHPATAWLMVGAGGVAVGVWMMFRYGLVALATALFTTSMLNTSPITLDPWTWQVDLTLFTVAIVSAVALYGFFMTRAGPSSGQTAALEQASHADSR